MTDMVERVDTAIAEALWGKGARGNQQTRKSALAAIQAMREPTMRMQILGGLELAEDEKPEGFPHLAGELWRQMIDAALGSAKTEG